MKTLTFISYTIGSILLIISCFTISVTTTWWLGGFAVACLVFGCGFQFIYNKDHDPVLSYKDEEEK